MTTDATRDDRDRLLRMEAILAGLLRYGAIVASGWIALGLASGAFKEAFLPGDRPIAVLSDRCLAIGIVLLISLPVLRVALMTAIFLLEKDYRLAAISATVLAIIALGFLLGTAFPHLGFL